MRMIKYIIVILIIFCLLKAFNKDTQNINLILISLFITNFFFTVGNLKNNIPNYNNENFKKQNKS